MSDGARLILGWVITAGLVAVAAWSTWWAVVPLMRKRKD